MNKKILTLALILILASLLLTACTSDPAPASSPSPTVTPEQTQEPTQEGEDETPTPEDETEPQAEDDEFETMQFNGISFTHNVLFKGVDRQESMLSFVRYMPEAGNDIIQISVFETGDSSRFDFEMLSLSLDVTLAGWNAEDVQKQRKRQISPRLYRGGLI